MRGLLNSEEPNYSTGKTLEPQWQRSQPAAGQPGQRIRDRGRDRRHARAPQPGRRRAAIDEPALDQRRRGHSERGDVQEVPVLHGTIPDLNPAMQGGCDGIVIESNHSRDMLKTCPVYSWELKQRILARTGHLSNEDLCEWLTNDFDGSARHVVLAHLSQRANEPHLAKLMAETALQMRPNLFQCETQITLSRPKEPTEWISF